MAGRNKEPIDLLLAKNKKHLSKKEIETRRSQEIKTESNDISPPEYLDDKQKNEFNKLAEKLKKVNIISDLDVDALAHYILSKDEFLKIDKLLQKELNKKRIDVERLSKIQITHNKIHNQVRNLASDLGLNITARARLIIPKPPDPPEENPFSRFIK